MLLVILSSLSYAVYIVGVNHSTLKLMSTAKLTFYALLFGLSIYIVRLNFCADLQAVPSFPAWGNILAMAFLPTVISLVCTAVSIHSIGSTPTAILGALEPVTALFLRGDDFWRTADSQINAWHSDDSGSGHVYCSG